MIDQYDCAHTRTQIVWAAKNSHDLTPYARKQLRRQCLACGKLMTGELSHIHARSDTPQMDEELVRRAMADREAADAKRQQVFQRRREDRDRAFWDKYHAHMDSEKWRQTSALVKQRANFICEGCGINPADHTHHLDYKNLGDEFLWELKAVCIECHARTHPHRATEWGL